MKKHMITLTLLLFAAVVPSTLLAQTSEVSATLTNKFEKEFDSVSNARWTITPNAFVVTFLKAGESLIAIYDKQEQHVATGRRIKDNRLLPMSVQKGLERERERCERKYGSIDVGYVFEMSETTGLTHYVVAIQTSKQTLNFELSPDGSSALRKTAPNPYPKAQPSMIAKKQN